MSGVTIIPGNFSVNQMSVSENMSVGGDIAVGGNVSITGNFSANNVEFNPTNVTLISDPTISVVSNLLGTSFEIAVNIANILPTIQTALGTIVSSVNGITGPVTLSSDNGTVTITSNLSTLNFRAQSNVPAGTVSGAYLYWNGTSYVSGTSNILIGGNAGGFNQGSNAIAIGLSAGTSNQGANSVAIGLQAGTSGQQACNVAIGFQAGQSNQQTGAVAVGPYSGTINQQTNTVAIGNIAGYILQGSGAVSMGYQAGYSNQGCNAVAIASQAGKENQSGGAVAIGFQAGQSNQGCNAIAIGSGAGSSNQPANSIVLSTSALNATGPGFFVNPIRASSNLLPLVYNPSTSEISYNPSLGVANWSYYSASSNIDTAGNYIYTSVGSNVSISGNTVIVGSTTVSEYVGTQYIISNDSNIPLSLGVYDSVRIQAWGGGGGNGCNLTSSTYANLGGAGGYTDCILKLTTQAYISISLGGAGFNPPTLCNGGGAGGNYGGAPGSSNAIGTNPLPGLGGAGGGGATVVRTNNGILTIAGGGGGGGTSSNLNYGGNAGINGQSGYSATGGFGGGAINNTGGTGGIRSGFTSGNSGTSGVGTPSTFAPGGPSLPTFGYTGGGGGGAGWGGGGGATAASAGGGGSSYIFSNVNICNAYNAFPSTTPGQPAYSDPVFRVGGSTQKGGVILTFFSASVTQLAPGLTVTNGPIRATEFNTATYNTLILSNGSTSNVFTFSSPGLYQCFSYSTDSNAYMAKTEIGVNYSGNAIVMNTCAHPFPGLAVSIASSNTYSLTNNAQPPSIVLSNILTKITKLG